MLGPSGVGGTMSPMECSGTKAIRKLGVTGACPLWVASIATSWPLLPISPSRSFGPTGQERLRAGLSRRPEVRAPCLVPLLTLALA